MHVTEKVEKAGAYAGCLIAAARAPLILRHSRGCISSSCRCRRASGILTRNAGAACHTMPSIRHCSMQVGFSLARCAAHILYPPVHFILFHSLLAFFMVHFISFHSLHCSSSSANCLLLQDGRDCMQCRTTTPCFYFMLIMQNPSRLHQHASRSSGSQ